MAAIAYVDPGNVAANITAGARFGYLLLWVLVVSNAIALVVQFESAKLGIVTGRTLPELLAERLSRNQRIAFWLQAETVAAATDLAEVVGGAIAMHLLFGLPLVVGGLLVGLASMLLLEIQTRAGQHRFELAIIGLLVIITAGFIAGLFVPAPGGGSAVDVSALLDGLIPRFAGGDSVLLAASMMGATVMPHAIYVHSALARDHHRTSDPSVLPSLLRATRNDVLGALGLAGSVNLAILILAAAHLQGVPGTDTIGGAHAAIVRTLGPVVGAVFGVGLLASGLASTSVGSYAGATIMAGLLRRRVPLLVRRAVTLLPALLLLALGAEPTWVLVLSQVVLSFGIPFAMVPLVRLTSDRLVMGAAANGAASRVLLGTLVALVIALNGALLLLLAAGRT